MGDDVVDAQFSTLATDTLRRLLWAAKRAPCTCIQSAGQVASFGDPGLMKFVSKRHDCPRCAAIRDACEAVPDGI